MTAWQQQSAQHHILCVEENAYPERLRVLDSPPLVLYCSGNPQLLKAPQIAIVGSRKATLQGLNSARRFARELGDNGITVTSGLALGIDGAAHQGAFATAGRTIGILGGGLDQVYPRSHLQLAAKVIAHQGCLISEFPPWEKVRPYHFPRRNRLIAALSYGVLLIEAKIKSGSMITASLAADLGVDVFAMPGNINNPLSEGPHYLIQQGAKLVAQVSDILEEYGWRTEAPGTAAATQACTDARCAPVMQALGGEAVSIDQLAATTGLSVSQLMPRLAELELTGLVEAVPGGYLKK